MSLFTILGYVLSICFSMTRADSILCGGSVTGTINTGASILFDFSNGMTRDVTFTNCQSSFDTKMFVFGTSGQVGSSSVCDGDDCSDSNYPCSNSLRETFTMSALAQGDYTILLEPYSSGGTYVVQVICETTLSPTATPTADPTAMPTVDPTRDPTADPTVHPSADPTADPTRDPSSDPSALPTMYPSADPTAEPTMDPTGDPTANPTAQPSSDPTIDPTADPISEPTQLPSRNPTAMPTGNPSADPTKFPSADPSTDPTANPTHVPTQSPTADPSYAQITEEGEVERTVSTAPDTLLCMDIVETMQDWAGLKEADILNDDALKSFIVNSTKLAVYDSVRRSHKYHIDELCAGFRECLHLTLTS